MDGGGTQDDEPLHLGGFGGAVDGLCHGDDLAGVADGGMDDGVAALEGFCQRGGVQDVAYGPWQLEARHDGEAAVGADDGDDLVRPVQAPLFDQTRADKSAGSNDGDFHRAREESFWAVSVSAGVSQGMSRSPARSA